MSQTLKEYLDTKKLIVKEALSDIKAHYNKPLGTEDGLTPEEQKNNKTNVIPLNCSIPKDLLDEEPVVEKTKNKIKNSYGKIDIPEKLKKDFE